MGAPFRCSRARKVREVGPTIGAIILPTRQKRPPTVRPIRDQDADAAPSAGMPPKKGTAQTEARALRGFGQKIQAAAADTALASEAPATSAREINPTDRPRTQDTFRSSRIKRNGHRGRILLAIGLAGSGHPPYDDYQRIWREGDSWPASSALA